MSIPGKPSGLQFFQPSKGASSDVFQEAAHTINGQTFTEWTSPWSDQQARQYRLRATFATTLTVPTDDYIFAVCKGDPTIGGTFLYVYSVPSGANHFTSVDTTVNLTGLALDHTLTFFLGVDGSGTGSVTVSAMTLTLTPA